MIYRLIGIVLVLFCTFYGFLYAMFYNGYLTRERTKKITKRASVALIALIFVLLVMSGLSTIDTHL